LVQFKQRNKVAKGEPTPKHGSQFHFGSIQTIFPSCNTGNNSNQSQFHFGSIQTNVKFRVCGEWNTGLNSTLVQFKHISFPSLFLFIISLNSTLVQFKLSLCITIGTYRCLLSQFHFGSIQTRSVLSQMVITLPVSIPLWFNSNSYLLKGLEWKRRKVSIPLWFNSNRDKNGNLIYPDNYLSQFHFGSIQTNYKNLWIKW